MINFRILIIGLIYLILVTIVCVDYNASYVTNETTLLENTILEPEKHIEEQKSDFELLQESCSIYESYENWYCMAEIPKSDWFYVDYIIFSESSYDMFAYNPGDDDGMGPALGLCQIKEKSIHNLDTYYLSPINQLKECDDFVKNYQIGPNSDGPKYGTWENAYNFHIENGWW